MSGSCSQGARRGCTPAVPRSFCRRLKVAAGTGEVPFFLVQPIFSRHGFIFIFHQINGHTGTPLSIRISLPSFSVCFSAQHQRSSSLLHIFHPLRTDQFPISDLARTNPPFAEANAPFRRLNFRSRIVGPFFLGLVLSCLVLVFCLGVAATALAAFPKSFGLRLQFAMRLIPDDTLY